MICRTLDEVRAAALDDARDDAPLSQNVMDEVAAILQPHLAQDPAA